MDSFRQLRDMHNTPIFHNNRYTQKSNRRLIRYPRQHRASIHSYNNESLANQHKSFNRSHRDPNNRYLSEALVDSIHQAIPDDHYPM